MTQADGGGVPAGTRLNGIYEVEERLAIGGMGEVYVGHVIQTGDKVAIKMILPEHANNEVIVDLFRREASTLHNLYHEAIVRYYVFSVDPDLNRPYLSMEFAAGPSLVERLRDDGPLGEAEMAVLCRRVAGGLHAAHKLGIIHRDISPDNIILVDGDVERAKLIDFGIAKSTTSEGTLIGSGFAGKLNYVSPEQLGLGDGEVTGKSDIYSLGLVFAQAVIGHPLPMGGSQVEVVEKRRTVPDLSEVPDWIRPLIEAMVQPDPAGRPADMQAVAEWQPGNAAGPGASGGGARLHPREQRRQRAAAEGGARKRGPWFWLGTGGVGVAAAAAVAFFLLGPPAGDVTGPGKAVQGGLTPAAGKVRLAAPVASAVAPEARLGKHYAWSSSPFDYGGDPDFLAFSVDGSLPPGVSLDSAGAAARLSGTPSSAGDYAFTIVARAPDGGSARMDVNLAVAGDEQSAAPEATDAAGATASDDVETTPAAASAPTPAQPRVALSAPAELAGPVAEGAAGASNAASGLVAGPIAPGPTAPGPVAPENAGGLPPVPTVAGDPAANAVEPVVAAVAPGGLSSPTGGAAGAVPALAEGGGLALPLTGATRPSQPSAVTPPADQPVVASVPAPQNQPPTIENAISAPVMASRGQSVNVRLGKFFDEAGDKNLTLKIEGSVPNGVNIRLAPGGVAQLYGSPTEFGDYQVRVAAVDPEGLVSRPLVVDLQVSPPAANKSVRDYILGYQGGDCFLSRPIELGPRLARIEVFAAADNAAPVFAFNDDFIRDMGFEASIEMRPLSGQQCPLIHALDQVGPQALDNSLVIDLDQDTLAPGDVVSGKIRGGQGARLFLYDNSGGVTDLSKYIETKNGETGFSIPITAHGPQILVATRPRDGADPTGSDGLEALLEAARQGKASVALGFFVMK